MPVTIRSSPKFLAIEEARRAQLGVELLDRTLCKSAARSTPISWINPSADRTVSSRALDRLRAAVTQQHPAAGLEFIALGMAAEIVVVVQIRMLAFFPPPRDRNTPPPGR